MREVGENLGIRQSVPKIWVLQATRVEGVARLGLE